MLPNLRNHAGTMASLFIIAAGFAALVLGCDTFIKTNSTLTPGKRVTAEQLAGEAAQAQAKFGGELADLNAGYQKLQQRVTAYNAEAAAAQADLQHRAETVQSVVQGLGGWVNAAATGTFNPMSLVSAVPTLLLGALGMGAMTDKKYLQTALTNQRLLYTPPPAAPPADPGPGPSHTPVIADAPAAPPAVTLGQTPWLGKAA